MVSVKRGNAAVWHLIDDLQDTGVIFSGSDTGKEGHIAG